MLKLCLRLTTPALLALSLTGCSLSPTEGPQLQTAASSIHGNVHGGRQPIQGSTITVYAVGTTGYGSSATALASTLSDTSGNFSFSPTAYTCPQSNTPVYILATGGDPGSGINPSVVLAASLGSCTQAQSATVNINEVTTAATAYALAQFFTNTLGSASPDSFGGPSNTLSSTVTYSKGLVAANTYTVPTLVNLGSGTASPSTSSVTVEATKLNSIANTLAACVNTTGATSTVETTTICGQLFAATLPPGGTTRPSDTLQAAVQMARYPYQNVSTLFGLAPAAAPFVPVLTSINDWTLGVKYTSTVLALTVTAGTTSNLDIDSDGNIWLPSTAPAGVAMFSPSTATFSGPYTTTGLTHPQNIAINSTGLVYAADLGSGLLTAFNPNGSSAGTFDTAQGNQGTVAIGPFDQIWLTSSNNLFGATNITELNGGPLSGSLVNQLGGPFTTTHYATGLTIMPNNDLYLATTSSSTGYIESFTPIIPGVIYNENVVGTYSSAGLGQIVKNGTDLVLTASASTQLCSLANGCGTAGAAGISSPQGVATDGDNNLWVSNSATASISTTFGSSQNFGLISSTPYLHDAVNGNTSVAPYGIGIDASGNVWASNQTNSTDPYVLSELIGAAAPTITPLSAQIAGGTNLVGTRPTN
jgi:hypothetical protein